MIFEALLFIHSYTFYIYSYIYCLRKELSSAGSFRPVFLYWYTLPGTSYSFTNSPLISIILFFMFKNQNWHTQCTGVINAWTMCFQLLYHIVPFVNIYSIVDRHSILYICVFFPNQLCILSTLKLFNARNRTLQKGFWLVGKNNKVKQFSVITWSCESFFMTQVNNFLVQLWCRTVFWL